MTDLEIQAAVDRAVTELARRLRPWAVAMADPEAFAAAFITAMREEGWRPPLRPGPDWRAPRRRPAGPNDEYLNAKARALNTREDTP